MTATNVGGGGAVAAYFGFLHFSLDQSVGGLLLTVFVEFFVQLVLRDVFSMAILHPIMHTKKWYWIHQKHHIPTKELTMRNSMGFDLLDLVIENMVGLVLFVGAEILLFGQAKLHFLSFLLMSHHDAVIHSCNPFTRVYWLPFVDELMLGTVAHNLHHAVQNSNFTAVPWHHLFSSSERKEAVARYNKIFKTDI
eukprot:TRINITY_DN1827_c0_g1_i2.p1 TRINITY_DN1827_c0_g1~~TRINITY_DN1827_c0_g1_i2.p1  ORF type:complete len:194 (-),score=36.29 TRINITY_DN1827_c0_g1_i2:366-947(-)